MANNGDVVFEDIENSVDLGGDLTAENRGRSDVICDEINSEVNLKLIDLGFSMPITETDSVNWLTRTKKFGVTALVLQLLGGQDTEEENTRSNWHWDKYISRCAELIKSGGSILNAPVIEDPRPNTMPVVIGEFDSDRRKRLLRFPQLAAVDHFENDRAARRVRKWSQIASKY